MIPQPTDTTPYPHRPRPLTQLDRDRMEYAWLVAAERRFPDHILTTHATRPTEGEHHAHATQR